MLAYTIMNGVSGPVIDRLGTRLGYALTIAWWSAAAVLHAFARGAFSLGAARFLLGMGEAGNWPGAVKVVAEGFPERERALASGIFNSGSAVGAILAAPSYLRHARHLRMSAIGKYSWIPFVVAGIGNYAGGWLSGYLLRRGWSVTAARKTGVTFFAALMTSAIPAVLVGDSHISIALVSVAMPGYTGASANMLPVFLGFGELPLICAAILWMFLGPLELGPKQNS